MLQFPRRQDVSCEIRGTVQSGAESSSGCVSHAAPARAIPGKKGTGSPTTNHQPMIASRLPAADRANDLMVDRLIADGSLYSRPLIAAFRETPRHRFLERTFQYHRKRDRWRAVPLRDLSEKDLELIYSDRALITRVSPADRS